MTTLEIIRSMSMEQAERVSPVVRAIKAGDLAGAKTVMNGLTVEERDILTAFLEAEISETRAKREVKQFT